MELNLPKHRPLTAHPHPSPETELPSSVDFTDLDKITEDSLDFSALTDGLGFHPKEKKIGELRPSNNMDEVLDLAAEPVERPPATDAPLLGMLATNATAPAPNFTAYETEISASATTDVETPTSRTATLDERAKAFALDLAIVALPLWLNFFWHFSGEKNFIAEHWLSAALFISVVFFVYLMITESLGGQSVGKMAFHLYVVEDNKYRKPIGLRDSARRTGFFILGSLPFGFGSLSAIWDSKSRTWHDKLSASIVERKFEA